jgi:hypothetical protein
MSSTRPSDETTQIVIGYNQFLCAEGWCRMSNSTCPSLKN